MAAPLELAGAEGGCMLNGKESGEVVALGFTAGFIGAVVVLLTATIVYHIGIGPALGVKSPLSLAPPYVYRPLVWGGFWGIPLAFILRSLKGHQMMVGFLYFLAPVAALLLVFLPMGGMGLLGLKGGPGIPVHAVIVNAPYGIVTTLAIAALGGRDSSSAGARLVHRLVGH
jgi:hypothetical protein